MEYLEIKSFYFNTNLSVLVSFYLSLTLGSRASLIMPLPENTRKCEIIVLWSYTYTFSSSQPVNM